MSKSGAIARAQNLREALLDHGVRSVSIELVRGRPAGPNDGWWTSTHVSTMGHHIVSHRDMGDTPGLYLVKVGRADLPGPICNGYGGFDEVARIICMGWANHPGKGGPFTVEAGTIPANNGRPYAFGWEFEGGIRISDFTDSYREFMGRCHAGTLAWLGRTERSHLEHKTWAPTRKVDRLGYSLASARAEAAAFLTPTPDIGDLVNLPISQGDHDRGRRSDIIVYQRFINLAFGTHRINEDGVYGINMASRLRELGVTTPDDDEDVEAGRKITGRVSANLIEAAFTRLAADIAGVAGSTPPELGDVTERLAEVEQTLTALRKHLQKS